MNPHAELIHRLRERARIRRQIDTRKSVQEGKPDRIAALLDEAASALETCEAQALQQAAKICEAESNRAGLDMPHAALAKCARLIRALSESSRPREAHEQAG